MGTIEQTVTVAVPAMVAFAFVRDWRNIGRFYDGVRGVTPVTSESGVAGARYTYEVKSPVLGYLSAETELRDLTLGRALTFITDQGVKSAEAWRFDPLPEQAGQCCITYTLAYDVPVPALGGMLDRLFVKRVWQKRIARSLQTLKTLLETESAATVLGLDE